MAYRTLSLALSFLFSAAAFADFESATSNAQEYTQLACTSDCGPVIRSLRSQTFLVSLPGTDSLRIAPSASGARLIIDGLRFGTAPVMVSDLQYVAELAAPSAASEARFFARHQPSRLRTRITFRLMQANTDGSIAIQVRALQIFHESSGDVVAEATRLVPTTLPVSAARTEVWNGRSFEDALVLHDTNHYASVEAKVLGDELALTYRIDAQRYEISRHPWLGTGCTLSIAPHPNGLLVIFTEVRPSEADLGRGSVLLIQVGDAPTTLATWTGTNTDTPPAWVTGALLSTN